MVAPRLSMVSVSVSQASPGNPDITAAELRVELYQVGVGGQWRGAEEGRQLTAPR